MPDDVRNILFLCTGNSARSILAEAILNAEGKGRYCAWSAGSHPAGAPHPFALDLLSQLGHDVSGLRSKNWNEFAAPDAPRIDFVITVCDQAAAETCPIWPGHPATAHWGLPDPAAVEGSEAERRMAFAETYRNLSTRISLLLSLPADSLDRLEMKAKLDEIGRAELHPQA